MEEECSPLDIEETPPASPYPQDATDLLSPNSGKRKSPEQSSTFLDEYVITPSSTSSTPKAPKQQKRATIPKPKKTKENNNNNNNNNNSNGNNLNNVNVEENGKKRNVGRPKKKEMEGEGSGMGGENGGNGGNGGSRFDSSLGLLTKRFTDLVRREKDGTIDLNDAADELNVAKRRIYDITNVLEGINLIEKKSKNQIHWRGSGLCTPEERKRIEELKNRIEELKKQEALEDEKTRRSQVSLKQMVEDQTRSQFAYITHDDVRTLPGMENQTLIAIKAPSGTRLEVPDPDEGMDGGDRRYQIFLQSENGAAIDVYLVSSERMDNNFQETTDETGTIEDLGHHQHITSHIGLEEPPIDTSGLLKIAPPGETDYYFNSMMDGEGISDFYTEDSEIFIQ